MSNIVLDNDALGRGRYAKNLYQIIADTESIPKTTDNESFVMAVSAPWGFGKTHFIKSFEQVLQHNGIKEGLDEFQNLKPFSWSQIIHYDAWKNDFCDNAFEPIFKEIVERIEVIAAQMKKDGSDNAASLEQAEEIHQAALALGHSVGFFKKLLTGTMPVSEELKTMIDKVKEETDPGSSLSDEIKALWKYTSEEGIPLDCQEEIAKAFPEFISFVKQKDQLISTLQKVTKHKKLVVVIDELDRCRPTFAVQTLEIVKHLFNVKNLIFIFSLDITELRHCVKVVYGNDFDSVGYLERFFNYTSLLPMGDRENLIKQTALEYHIFGKDSIFESQDDCVFDAYYNICEDFHLSLREIRTVFLSFYFFLRFEYKDKNILPVRNERILYFYLLVLKYKYPVEFTIAASTTSEAKKTRKDLLDKHTPPFIKYVEGKYKKSDIVSDTFNAVFLDNPIITEYDQFYAIDQNGLNTKNSICYNNMNEQNYSASLALYRNDLPNIPMDSKITLLEYYSRRIELYHSPSQANN